MTFTDRWAGVLWRGWSILGFFALVLVGCSGKTPTADAPAATPTKAVSSAVAGVARPPLPSGRILFNIEHEGTPSQPAYIDSTGIHVIPVPPDSSLAHPVWASSGGIIFDSERAGPRHIYRMEVDGSHVTQLTAGADSQDSPTVSPNGSLIVYGTAAGHGRDLGLHQANADGMRIHALTKASPAVGIQSGDDGATFSPDGHWIAYFHVVDAAKGLAGLWVMRSDGSHARQLTANSTSPSYPRWSPNGKQILFTEHEDVPPVSHPLWVIDVAGGAPRALTNTNDPGTAQEGDWSPDGRQIVFKYYRPGWDHNELRLINADGSNLRTLWVSPHLRTAQTPDWAN